MVGGMSVCRKTGLELELLRELVKLLIMRICNSLFFSVLTKEADSGGNVDTERKGHQPVILGGLYSAVEDEFLPGKTSLL